MDFLISHMSITGIHLSAEEKIDIVEGCLFTLLAKDFAFLKKFFLWFQGHLEDEIKPQKNDPTVTTIVPVIKRILLKFLNFQEEEKEETLSTEMFARNLTPTLNTPIVMLMNLFGDNLVIAELIIEEISTDLIRYIRHYYIEVVNPSRVYKNFTQNVKNLLVLLEKYID